MTFIDLISNHIVGSKTSGEFRYIPPKDYGIRPTSMHFYDIVEAQIALDAMLTKSINLVVDNSLDKQPLFTIGSLFTISSRSYGYSIGITPLGEQAKNALSQNYVWDLVESRIRFDLTYQMYSFATRVKLIPSWLLENIPDCIPNTLRSELAYLKLRSTLIPNTNLLSANEYNFEPSVQADNYWFRAAINDSKV